MKNKRLWSLLILFVMVLSTFLTVSRVSLASATEGAGTKESPYLIRTVKDLYCIPNNPQAHYKLMYDLDLGHVEREPMAEFKGVFDGNHHQLFNLNIKGNSSHTGLFKIITNGTVRNLTISSSSVKSNFTSTGMLVGTLNSGTLENISIINSVIKGNGNTGSLCGISLYGNFLNCKNIGSDINSSDLNAGGLIGYTSSSVIEQCYSLADVFSTSYAAGGLIGGTFNNNSIRLSFAEGKVTGTTQVGGLIGNEMSKFPVTIENCYSLVDAVASSESGNAAGMVSGHKSEGIVAKNCYSAGSITAPLRLGFAKGSITNCYFDKKLSGINTPVNEARTTEQMYQKSNYAGWDFENVWYIEEGKDYPRLRFMMTEPERVPLEKLELLPEKAEVLVGESVTLVPIYTPVNATNKNLTWYSTNPSIINVNKFGVVSAVAPGQGTIIAISEDGNHTAYCNLIVKQKETISNNIALEAIASSNSTLNDNYRANNANDGDGGTKWMAADSDYGIYLQLDFNKHKAFKKIKIKEMDNIIDEFAIQIWTASKWVDIYTGNAIGEAFECDFEPVTTDKVRLMLCTYQNGECPSINEFEIYN